MKKINRCQKTNWHLKSTWQTNTYLCARACACACAQLTVFMTMCIHTHTNASPFDEYSVSLAVLPRSQESDMFYKDCPRWNAVKDVFHIFCVKVTIQKGQFSSGFYSRTLLQVLLFRLAAPRFGWKIVIVQCAQCLLCWADPDGNRKILSSSLFWFVLNFIMCCVFSEEQDGYD